MNLKSKIKLVIFLSITFLILWSAKTFAASISVSPSTSSVAPGGSFTVTISGSDATGRINISATNGNVSPSSIWIENNSQPVTVTAGSSGSVTISASGEVSTNAGEDVNVSKSASVTINTPAPSTTTSNPSSGNATPSQGNNQSGNNGSGENAVTAPTLSNLGINPHDFSGFSSGRTSYTVNVPNDCTSINLYATSKNGSISGTGTKTLKEGTNKFTVTVSNSAGSKNYTVSVVRATTAGEDVPNVVEPEENEQVEEKPEEGIGLKSLEIADYKLEQEFKIDLYNYDIMVDEDVTQDLLNSIKEKIVAQSNYDKANVEISVEVLEDGKGIITLVVKDEEKEYSKYTITVIKKLEEKEAESTVVGAVKNKPSNNDKGGFSLKNIPNSLKAFIVLGIYILTLYAAIVFACIAYVKSKKLREFEEEYEIVDDEETEDESERLNALEGLPENSSQENLKDAEKKLNKLDGYRNLRSAPGKNGGRHF